jgi:D-alanyl-D-alanine dipeptidase
MKKLFYLFFIAFLACKNNPIPDGFVSLEESVPSLLIELRYSTTDNFVGEIIDGYRNPKIVLTLETVNALNKVQNELNKQGLGLKIFDGYRPQKAVNHFIRWAKKLNDTLKKEKYYPMVRKDKLFEEGYVAERSGHSRGSTVDVTLIRIDTLNYGQELDMGSEWDYFGVKSWTNYDSISSLQKENRRLLQDVMIKFGFKPYSKEWWHFTLENEPFSKTYFDF